MAHTASDYETTVTGLGTCIAFYSLDGDFESEASEIQRYGASGYSQNLAQNGAVNTNGAPANEIKVSHAAAEVETSGGYLQSSTYNSADHQNVGIGATGVTIMFWVYALGGSSSDDHWVSKGERSSSTGEYNIFHNEGSDALYCHINGGDDSSIHSIHPSTSGAITENAWNHIAVTIADNTLPTTVTLYVNGVDVTGSPTDLIAGVVPASNDGLNVFRHRLSASTEFADAGTRLHDLSIHDGVLSAANVLTAYESGLVHYQTDTISLTDTSNQVLIQTQFSIASTLALQDVFTSGFRLPLSSTLGLSDETSFIAVLSGTSTLSLTDAFAGTMKWIWSSTIDFSDSFVASQRFALVDSIALASVSSIGFVQTQVAVNDTVALTDGLYWIALQQLEDSLDLSDSITVGRTLQLLADTFRINDSFLAIIQKSLSISDEFALGDSLSLNYRWELSDAISFVDAVVEKIRFILNVSSSLSLSDSTSFSFSVLLSTSSTLALSDSFAEIIQKLFSISSTISLVGQMRLDSETYLVWAFNPRTLGAYKLRFGKRLRGITRLSGKNLLVAEDGIYEVSGSTDAGAEIPQLLKTGLVDFDDPERHLPGQNLKDLVNAFLVMTVEGETLLKVTTTRHGTAKATETWFRCIEKPSTMAKREVPLSDSLRSVLFQFEIVPLKGKPMKLHQVEVIPLFLHRSQ